MNPNDFSGALRTAFASQYAFLIKAQHAHWNILGRHFYSDHLLLERIYQEVEETIDPLAENLRKCQVMVPAGVETIDDLSVIKDFDADSQPADEMLQTLLDDCVKMSDLFSAMFDIAERQGEHGLSNFFADRQDAFKGHAWMLRSSLAD